MSSRSVPTVSQFVQQLDFRFLPYVLAKPISLALAVVGLVFVILLTGFRFLSGDREARAQIARPTTMNIFSLFDRAGAIGRLAFSQLLFLFSPYSASVEPLFEVGKAGHIRASIWQWRGLQNPFASVHAAALTNIGELVAFGAVLSLVEARRGKNRAIPTSIRTKFLKKACGRLTTECQAPPLPDAAGKVDLTSTAFIRNQAGEVVCEVEVTASADLVAVVASE